MKLRYKALSFLMALLLLLSTLTGCTGYVDPLGYLKDATVKTIKNTLVGELLALLLDISDKGMISVEFGGTDLVQNLPESAELTLWLDNDDRKIAADGKMTLAGEKYDISAYIEETEMAVISSSFLGSNTLGVDFLSLKDDLKTSIFSNNSGTVFSDPTVSSASADRIEQIKKSFFKLIAYNEKTLDFADEVLEVFLDELTSYAANTRYKEDGYTHITLSINNDSLARALRATRDRLVKDRSFCKYLNELAETLDSMISAVSGVTSTEYTTKVRHFLTNEEDIDNLCQHIDDADAFVFEVKAAVKSFGMSLSEAELSFTQGGIKRFEGAVSLFEDEITLAVTLDGVARKLTYHVKEDGFRTYRAELSYQLTSAAACAEVKGELLANKRENTYTLTLEKGSETRVFGGSYDFDDEEMMLSVNTASVNGADKRISLKITLTEGEGVPMMPNYVNVAAIDVARFTPIYERAVKTRDRLLTDWQALGLSADVALRDLFGAIGLPEEISANS